MKTHILVNKPKIKTVHDLELYQFFVLDTDKPDLVFFTVDRKNQGGYGIPEKREVLNVTNGEIQELLSKQKVLRGESISVTLNLHGV